jgi:hypothetical protein
MADDPALERLRAAIRRLDGPQTMAELGRCKARPPADARYQSIADYALRRLWRPAPGRATDAAGADPDTGLAVGPLQQVLQWLLREEIEEATRLFVEGHFAETRRVCEQAARIDGHCARLALLRAMAMARDAPNDWLTLLDARRWLTVAATDHALQDECRRTADRLDDALSHQEQAELKRLTENYNGIRRVYARPALYYTEVVNMRASLIALRGRIDHARKLCRPSTTAARSLDALARAVTSDLASLRAMLRI